MFVLKVKPKVYLYDYPPVSMIIPVHTASKFEHSSFLFYYYSLEVLKNLKEGHFRKHERYKDS